jgi:hypothetical protein
LPQGGHKGRPYNAIFSHLQSPGAHNLTMETFLIYVLFLVVWFLVLPRIPGVSRFT